MAAMPDFNSHVWTTTALYSIGGNLAGPPDEVVIRVVHRENPDWQSKLQLRLADLNVSYLSKAVPWLELSGESSAAETDSRLLRTLRRGLEKGTIPKVLLVNEMGAVTDSSGNRLFIRGSTQIGQAEQQIQVSPDVASINLKGRGSDAGIIASLLISFPKVALLVLAFVLQSSIRSLILAAGINLQSVLYVVGPQGCGKTTLVERVSPIYMRSDGRDFGVVQAGSTPASIRRLLEFAKDCTIHIDDLCLSASSSEQNKRVNLAAQLTRLGADDIVVTKMAGGRIVEQGCQAGLILTAEFPLENRSDLTRCLIVPVTKQLDLSDDITPELCGDAVRVFSEWLTTHAAEAIFRIKNAVSGFGQFSEIETRMSTNYGCLKAVFGEFLMALGNAGVSLDICGEIETRMRRAIYKALESHCSMLDALDEDRKRGNLAYIILMSVKSGFLRKTKDPYKLDGKHYLHWQGDICLLPEVLVNFVRQQPGYHHYTRPMIVQELMDDGLVKIQQNGKHPSYTVKVEKGAPGTYRLIGDRLEESAEEFK